MGNTSGRRPTDRVIYHSSVDRVFQCSLKKWAKTESTSWGFDHRIQYETSLEQRLQPWATCGRYITAEVSKHVTYNMCTSDANFEVPPSSDGKWISIEENFFSTVVHVPQWYSLKGVCNRKEAPLTLSDRFNAKVIGARNETLVVQLVHENESQSYEWTVDILVIKMNAKGSYEVKSMFTFNTLVLPYLMEAILSPDLKLMCLKPSWHFIISFSQYPTENNMMVVDISKEKGVLRHKLFETNGTECVIAFDPRYEWRHLIIGNRSGPDECISLYDLKDLCIFRQSDKSRLKQTTHNLVYSPDGNYIASLVISPEASAWRGTVKVIEMVIIYSSDDLDILSTTTCNHRAAPINRTPAAMFPLFSKAGDYICFQKDNVRKYRDWQVVVLALPFKLSLQFICRAVIRKKFTSDEIRRFSFPQKLKDFILFSPYLQ